MPTTSFAQSLHEKSGGAIPLETATPEEVRMYITELLIDDYFTPPDEAKRHASKWEIGRCSQLFLNDEKAQRRIFGENVGLCIHRSLQQRMRALWEREPSVRYGNYASLASAALLVSVTIYLIFTLDLTKAVDLRTLAKYSVLWVLNGACGVYTSIKSPFDQVRCAILGTVSILSIMIGICVGTAALASA